MTRGRFRTRRLAPCEVDSLDGRKLRHLEIRGSCRLVRIQPRLCGTAADHAGTIPAPPVEEPDEQSDPYANQDHRADDTGSGDEGIHESRCLASPGDEP